MKVLIADDETGFRQVLNDLLVRWGYEVVAVANGFEAWEFLRKGAIPLAILDWAMPGIDGLEVCRRIRREIREPYVYVIICTAQQHDLVQGMEAGGDDYITKPLNVNELRVRLNAGKRIVELQGELVAAREKLAAHAADLESANRDLEAFGYAVSNALLKSLMSIGDAAKSIEGLYCGRQDPQCLTFTQRIYEKTKYLAQLIGLMHDFFRPVRTELHRETVDLSALAGRIAERTARGAPERRVAFRIAPGATAHADAKMLEIVLQNLLDNAWKHTAGKGDPLIEFGVTDVEGKKAFFVRDNGSGFRTEERENLFKPFQSLGSADAGQGIGLAKVERIIRRHGGSVWAEGKPGEGATFFFTLG